MKRLSMLLLFVCAGNVFGAASSSSAAGSHKPYQGNSPYFYAVLAEASYSKDKADARRKVKKFLKADAPTVLDHTIYKSVLYGETAFIIAKDKAGRLHVAIEGTTPTSLRNWGANIALPARGLGAEYDVPPRMRGAFHKIIKDWEKKFRGRVTTVVGHSQGGMYASQTVASCKKHYKNATIITFNCYKPKAKSNQLHFKTDNQHCTTLVSPSRRYIDIKRSGPHWQLVRNHMMKFFLEGLHRKDWSYLGL